jgi:hypothetical protein
MKYKSLKELVDAAKSGGFEGTVFVDNDYSFARSNIDNEGNVFRDDNLPEYLLVEALILLGLKAEIV